jgi:FlaG/FlaF family flagellin (archaellin)
MFNEKGQAFSVFELMIAAIVAIAILFVLLPIINTGFSPTSDSSTSIGNALASVENGGSTSSQNFSLEKNDTITSKDWVDKGFSEQQIVIGYNDNVPQSNSFETMGGDEWSGIEYTGNTPVTVSAKVVCRTTGADLEATTDSLMDDVEDTDGTPEDLCGSDGEYSPCCYVIIQRKK